MYMKCIEKYVYVPPFLQHWKRLGISIVGLFFFFFIKEIHVALHWLLRKAKYWIKRLSNPHKKKLKKIPTEKDQTNNIQLASFWFWVLLLDPWRCAMLCNHRLPPCQIPEPMKPLGFMTHPPSWLNFPCKRPQLNEGALARPLISHRQWLSNARKPWFMRVYNTETGF